MREITRFDFVFSYWIFAWYLLYMVKFVKSSPKLALGLGIIGNIVLLTLVILFGANLRTILSFIMINSIIKVIPYYSLHRETIRARDVKPIIILFIMYCCWIYYNKQGLTGNYKMIFDSLVNNRYDTPAMSFMNRVFT